MGTRTENYSSITHFGNACCSLLAPPSVTLVFSTRKILRISNSCRCSNPVTRFLAVTPDVQLIVDTALSPNVDVRALFGIRLRVAFS